MPAGEPLSIDLRRLQFLSLRCRGGLAGFYSGKRLSRRYGTSLEFADYRPYLPGDDPRRIDWPLYGRSRRLYTRLNRSEVDATVNFLVDSSGSMDWGEPHKGRRALELALALSYLSLQACDRVSVGLGAQALQRYLPPLYGKGSFGRVRQFLEQSEFGGAGGLNALLRSFHRRLRPHQLTVLLTDFLSPEGYRAGLRRLLAGRQELLVFYLFSPDELEPPLRGPVNFVDVETGQRREVDLDPYLLRRYRETAAAYRREIAAFCRRHEIAFFAYCTDRDPVEYLLEIAPLIFKTS